MRTPADGRSWARLTYDRRVFTWLALCSSRADADIDLSLPLHPPAALTALGEGATVGEWIRAWAGAALPAGCEVMWEERRWRALGAQRVPTALRVKTASAAAELGGRAKDWAMLTERLAAIRCALTAADVVHNVGGLEAGVAEAGVAEAGVAEATAAMARAMKSCARDLRQADVADFSRALEVTRWLVLNPESGLYVRQLPIAGVDTKWVDHHRRLIVALLTGARELPACRVRATSAAPRCLTPGPWSLRIPHCDPRGYGIFWPTRSSWPSCGMPPLRLSQRRRLGHGWC